MCMTEALRLIKVTYLCSAQPLLHFTYFIGLFLFLQKDYLIIMVISLKYFRTVTGAGVGVDCDERTSNTVYIHKQVCSDL